jgi:hypothetical protein
MLVGAQGSTWPIWWPAFVNAGRTFVAISAMRFMIGSVLGTLFTAII